MSEENTKKQKEMIDKHGGAAAAQASQLTQMLGEVEDGEVWRERDVWSFVCVCEKENGSFDIK